MLGFLSKYIIFGFIGKDIISTILKAQTRNYYVNIGPLCSRRNILKFGKIENFTWSIEKIDDRTKYFLLCKWTSEISTTRENGYTGPNHAESRIPFT